MAQKACVTALDTLAQGQSKIEVTWHTAYAVTKTGSSWR